MGSGRGLRPRGGEPGGGGHRLYFARSQKLSKPEQAGDWGCGKPGAGLGVGGEGELHDRGLQGLPPPPSQPLCVTPRPIVTGGPASSPRPATVDGEGRFLGPEEMGERLASLLFLFRHPGERGCGPRSRREVGKGGLNLPAGSSEFRSIVDPVPLAAWLLDPFPFPAPPSRPTGFPAPFPAAEVELRLSSPRPTVLNPAKRSH